MNGDDERDYDEEAAVQRDAESEGLAELEAERAEQVAMEQAVEQAEDHAREVAEQPIDVDGYEAAGVARVEDDECDGDCDCNHGACDEPDEWCDHCQVHCCCTPCEYASVA